MLIPRTRNTIRLNASTLRACDTHNDNSLYVTMRVYKRTPRLDAKPPTPSFSVTESRVPSVRRRDRWEEHNRLLYHNDTCPISGCFQNIVCAPVHEPDNVMTHVFSHVDDDEVIYHHLRKPFNVSSGDNC